MSDAEAIRQLKRMLAEAHGDALLAREMAELFMEPPYSRRDHELEAAFRYGMRAARTARDVIALQRAIDALKKEIHA